MHLFWKYRRTNRKVQKRKKTGSKAETFIHQLIAKNWYDNGMKQSNEDFSFSVIKIV